MLFKTQTYLYLKYEKTLEDGVKTVKVPRAREGNGFTLLLEVFVIQMANSISIKEVAKILKEKNRDGGLSNIISTRKSRPKTTQKNR